MPRKRHRMRRLAEGLGQAVAESPLWMLDAQGWGRLAQHGQLRLEEPARPGTIGADCSAPELTIAAGGVAVIPITGLIVTREDWYCEAGYATSQQGLVRRYQAAMASDQVRAIAFYVDSPGGMAQGNEEACLAMLTNQGKKPCVAYTEGMMCSAAYYLGSVADRIFAGPSALVGSIGSIVVLAEFTEYLKAWGITPTVLRNPAKKALGNSFEKLSEAGKASWQSKIDALTAMFEAAVARQRNLAIAEVRANYGQGESFFASAAHQRGLIDQVGSWGDALAWASAAASAAAAKSRPSAAQDAVQGSVSLPPLPCLLESTMDPRLKAALFARGLIASLEASDAECQAALRAFYAGRGQDVPSDPSAALAGLMAANSPAAAPAAAASPASVPADNSGAASANVQAAHDRELAEARSAAAANERGRIYDLRARGQALGISSQQVEAAIAGGQTLAQALEAWTASLASTQAPIVPVAGGHGGENFQADAGDALAQRCGVTLEAARSNAAGVRQLRNASLPQLAALSLQQAGQRVDPYGDREEICERAMAMEGGGRFGMTDTGTRPGSFPNLLSSLANRLLDEGLQLADSTYEAYTGVFRSDLPDFKAAPIVNAAGPDELQEVLDAEMSKEVSIAEECISQIFLRRYSGFQPLTVVMAANDDLDAWAQRMTDLARAWDNTVNRLCLRQATGNVTLLDGYAFYDNTNRGNDVTAGAAPSDSQWDGMQLKTRAMKGINNENYLRQRLDRILIPPQLERVTRQVFAPWGSMSDFMGAKEAKMPATDATLNVYRGMLTIIVEPELQATSTVQYYGFCDPRIAPAIKRAYFRGWPREGKRQRWYKPETKTTYFELEGRVGVAVNQPRNSVRNAGA